MHKKSIFRRLNMTVLVVGMLLAGIFVGQHLPNFSKSSEPKVTVATTSAKLKNIGELSTEKYTYTGLYKLSQGQIPFITKKGFSMVYTANFKAGIKAKDINIKVTDNTVKVTLPKAQILDASIDPSSIKFYDQSYALFNWNKKEDVTSAEKSALKRATKVAKKSDLIPNSEKHAKTLVKQILSSSIGSKKLVVNQAS